MRFQRLLMAFLVTAAAPVAQADVVLFGTSLAPEALGATGSGTVQLTWDSVERTLAIDANWAGLSGMTTVAHIHCCTAAAGTGTAGVAVTPGTLPDFPAGTTSGSYDVVLDMTSAATYTGAFLTGPGGGTTASAEAAIIKSFYDGTSYLNIHSNLFPTGEIRGFLAPLAVPEPGSYGLILLGLGAITAAKRRRGA
jgi:CHRD domain/PEP-CTERM motif